MAMNNVTGVVKQLICPRCRHRTSRKRVALEVKTGPKARLGAVQAIQQAPLAIVRSVDEALQAVRLKR